MRPVLARPGKRLALLWWRCLLIGTCVVTGSAVALGMWWRPASPVPPVAARYSQVSPTCARTHNGVCRAPPYHCCERWRPTSLSLETDALLVDPRDHDRVLAGTPSGLWRSVDGGITWKADAAWTTHSPIMALAAMSSRAGIVAGAGDGAVYAATGDNRIGAWRRISPSFGPAPIFCLAYNSQLRVLLAGTVGALYRGEQRGARWQWRRVATTAGASVTAVVWMSGNPRRGYASVFGSEPPVLSTADGGHNWRPDARGLPPTLPTESLLTVHGETAQVWLSTMGNGVWLRSGDGMWHDIDAGLPNHHAMPLTGGPTGVLYAGTMGNGVYRRQGTSVWRTLGSGLSTGRYIVLSLALVNSAKSSLLAGTARGVFRYPWP